MQFFQSAPAGRGKKRTQAWFALHGWCGLPVWLFLFFVCVTGTIATPDAPNAVAWVNPFTGTVQRVAGGVNFSDLVRSLHGWLLMPWFDGTPIGWYAVTLLGLPLLGSVVTGVVLYKRFWRAFVRPRLRLGSGARVFWGDAHRLAGAWSLWFVFVIAVTGLWFLVRGVMYDLHVPVGMEAPDIPRREAPRLAATDPRPALDLDGALAVVWEVRPGTCGRAGWNWKATSRSPTR